MLYGDREVRRVIKEWYCNEYPSILASIAFVSILGALHLAAVRLWTRSMKQYR